MSGLKEQVSCSLIIAMLSIHFFSFSALKNSLLMMRVMGYNI